MLAVVCMKWGTMFPADYVNVLYGAIKKNVSEPFRFICFTDDAKDLHPEIEPRPIPDMGLPPERWKHGCWPKLAVFKPHLIEGATQMLYLDLDLVVLQSLDPLLERARRIGGFHIMREWNYGLWYFVPLFLRPDRGAQSSIFVCNPQEQGHIYRDFIADQDAAFRRAHNDQRHLTFAALELRYLPYSWFISFKRDCLWRWPLNMLFSRIPKPHNAKVVVFHGQPRPYDVVREGNERWGTRSKFGYGPVAWVRDYWLEALRH